MTLPVPTLKSPTDIRAAVQAFLDRVPQFDGSGHTRLVIGGQPLGWVNATTAAALAALPDRFACTPAAITCRDDGLDAAGRSRLLQATAEELRDAGLITGWRGELYRLADARDDEILRLERAAFRTFGLQSRAVHVNGWTPEGRLWIGQRSPRKPTDPGKLDNFAAGGVTAGEDDDTCAIRELWEEAGVPGAIARHARPAGRTIRACRPVARGVHDELLVCYDIEVPDGFVPECRDGEVAGFHLLDVADVAERLAAGLFTWDAGLVTADALRRRGLLDESTPVH